MNTDTLKSTETKDEWAPDRNVGAVAVVGAGIAGMQSALDLAESGYRVYLLEKNTTIGGVMAQLDKTFPTNDCSTCMISPKLIEVAGNPNIEIITGASIEQFEGRPGDFTLGVLLSPRYVDESRCTACGECAKVCPVEISSTFNEDLSTRKAAYKHFPQAIPSAFAIEKKGTAPCKAACPAHISVQGYVALIRQGKIQEALNLIRRDNPLPAICGRVCTHPCEAACSRGDVDEAIAIKDLKRVAADYEFHSGAKVLPAMKESRKEKVAVVGSGPAGLSAAYYLALEGYGVTIFETLPAAGGMLRYGIPEYRLPRDILDYEIDFIREMGVEIRLNTPVEDHETLSGLQAGGYSAAFLATGAHKPLELNVEGEDLDGVYQGVDFLRRIGLGDNPPVGKRVAVIGGGNVAMDAVRSALRIGAREACIIYRRSEEEMPAYGEEIEEAREENVRFHLLTTPTKILGDPNGRVQSLELIRMELGEPDESGRRRPVPVAGSEYRMEVDTVITAIGQTVASGFDPAKAGLKTTRRATFAVDPITFQTSVPWIFAGGDMVSGPATVIEAVAAGKEAAVSIDRMIRGEDLRAGRERPVTIAYPEPASHAPHPRQRFTRIDAPERIHSFSEVQRALTLEQAKDEAGRCLSCGVCSECYQCIEACQANAIRHDMEPGIRKLNVGAVVLAGGYRPFEAERKPEYGYGRYPNVITSLEFERILSAAGPFAGHIRRLSDGKDPVRIAWIQCVGSRDSAGNQDYCSSVCCMYATKQAIIAKEHDSRIQPTIFFMDIRAHGKGFDRYYERAKTDHGIRYTRSMISRVTENPVTHDLYIHYLDEQGAFQDETFDLVILSVGLRPHPETADTARKLGVRLNAWGFAEEQPFDLVATSREGVYCCGVLQSPKDIPETVAQASSAAAKVQELLWKSRGSLIDSMDYPEERDVLGEEPRIGVFVCHCGINIAGIVDVKELAEYAKSLPHVEVSSDTLFACSTDSQSTMREVIRQHNLNRVVVTSCSPRTHEPLFQDNLQKAGLNKYLFEMANIRDQCSWVHQQHPKEATEKAKDLLRMSVARASLLEPLHEIPFEVTRKGLVVGGGVSGMTAALSLADQGFETTLVEKNDMLGGEAVKLFFTARNDDTAAYVRDLDRRIREHPKVTLLTGAEIVESKGHVGKFATTVRKDGGLHTVEHGATIIATGGSEYAPQEYLFGWHPAVLTQRDFHGMMAAGDKRIKLLKSVAMIQCVGSREPEHPYCSRICCTQAVTNALKLKEINPNSDVYILYRDIRTFGMNELYYKKARQKGVRFIRYDPTRKPEVADRGNELTVTVFDQNMHTELELPVQAVILSAAIRPRPESKPLASTLKLPMDADGFFLEAHVKLRPLEFSNAGHFLCGLAHSPKFLEESVAQAKGAASRAATILSKERMLAGGQVAVVDRERCVLCMTCARTCPFGVPKVADDGFIHIDAAECRGCGNCASACPRKLIQVQHMKDDQTIAKETGIYPLDDLIRELQHFMGGTR